MIKPVTRMFGIKQLIKNIPVKLCYLFRRLVSASFKTKNLELTEKDLLERRLRLEGKTMKRWAVLSFPRTIVKAGTVVTLTKFLQPALRSYTIRMFNFCLAEEGVEVRLNADPFYLIKKTAGPKGYLLWEDEHLVGGTDVDVEVQVQVFNPLKVTITAYGFLKLCWGEPAEAIAIEKKL